MVSRKKLIVFLSSLTTALGTYQPLAGQELPGATPAETSHGDSQNSEYSLKNFDGHYLMPPNHPRGIIFEYPTVYYGGKSVPDKTEEAPEQREVLRGFVNTIGAPDEKDLVPVVPEEDVAKDESPIEGRIKLDDINLKARTPITHKENKRLLIASAVRNHGTTGILLIAYRKGPWMIHTVLKGTPAEKYGLKPGDVIESIDGEKIKGLPIDSVYFRITGQRGQYKYFKIRRGAKILDITIPLWSIYDIKYQRSQYIEYYWFLLYHKYITLAQYHKMVNRFLYFKPPKLAPAPK